MPYALIAKIDLMNNLREIVALVKLIIVIIIIRSSSSRSMYKLL